MIIHLGIRSLFVAIGGSISKKKQRIFGSGGGGGSLLLYYMYVCTYIVYNTVHVCMYMQLYTWTERGSNWNKHVVKAASRHTATSVRSHIMDSYKDSINLIVQLHPLVSLSFLLFQISPFFSFFFTLIAVYRRCCAREAHLKPAS